MSDTLDPRRFPVDLHVVFRRDDQILLGRRKNTGYGDGLYHLCAGHLEIGETIIDGAIREAAEETGVAIAAADLSLVLVLHEIVHEGRICFFSKRPNGRARSPIPSRRNAKAGNGSTQTTCRRKLSPIANLPSTRWPAANPPASRFGVSQQHFN